MINYKPALSKREIVMISDYDTFDCVRDILDEQEFLSTIENQLKDYNLNFKYIEVKDYDELETSLDKLNRKKTIIFNWCEQLLNDPYSFANITGIYEKKAFIYSGADSSSLETTRFKTNTKRILLENKVSTPNHILPENLEDGTTIKFPVIIKSNKDHGSFWMSGDSIVNSKEVLKNRFNKFSQETGRDFMAEEFIDGPEFTLGVWGNKNPESLSVLELQFPKGRKNTSKIYSYNCKWNKNSFYFKNTGIVHATNIAKTLEKRIKSEALKAYKALDCCGFARIDVRVHNGVPYVIDVNLNPYLGPDSEFLMSSNYHGFNNGETVIKLCDYALEKFEHLI